MLLKVQWQNGFDGEVWDLIVVFGGEVHLSKILKKCKLIVKAWERHEDMSAEGGLI